MNSANYFSTRGVVSLIAIGLSAAIVSAFGQHSLTKLNVLANSEAQRSLELQRQVTSLDHCDERLRDAQSQHEQLQLLKQCTPLSRSLAELISWLPADAVLDHFAASSVSAGRAQVTASLWTQLAFIQLKAKPVAHFFSSVDLTEAADGSIHFSGTSNSVPGEILQNVR